MENNNGKDTNEMAYILNCSKSTCNIDIEMGEEIL
jgi:hypothetical protein